MFEVLSNRWIGNVHTKNGSSKTATDCQKLKTNTSKKDNALMHFDIHLNQKYLSSKMAK